MESLIKLVSALQRFNKVWPYEREEENYNVTSGDNIPYMFNMDGWGGYNYDYDYRRTKMLLMYLYSCGFKGNERLAYADNEADPYSIGQLREELRDAIFPVLEKAGVKILNDEDIIVSELLDECLEDGIITDERHTDLLDFLADVSDIDDETYVLSIFVEDSGEGVTERAESAEDSFGYDMVPSFSFVDTHFVEASVGGRSGVLGFIKPASLPYGADYSDFENLISVEGLAFAAYGYRIWEQHMCRKTAMGGA